MLFPSYNLTHILRVYVLAYLVAVLWSPLLLVPLCPRWFLVLPPCRVSCRQSQGSGLSLVLSDCPLGCRCVLMVPVVRLPCMLYPYYLGVINMGSDWSFRSVSAFVIWLMAWWLQSFLCDGGCSRVPWLSHVQCF